MNFDFHHPSLHKYAQLYLAVFSPELPRLPNCFSFPVRRVQSTQSVDGASIDPGQHLWQCTKWTKQRVFMRSYHRERRRMLFIFWVLRLVMIDHANLSLFKCFASGLIKRAGKTSDYCGTGCQIEFGTCGSPSEKSLYECGSTNGNLICDSGLCCSQFG